MYTDRDGTTSPSDTPIEIREIAAVAAVATGASLIILALGSAMYYLFVVYPKARTAAAGWVPLTNDALEESVADTVGGEVDGEEGVGADKGDKGVPSVSGPHEMLQMLQKQATEGKVDGEVDGVGGRDL